MGGGYSALLKNTGRQFSGQKDGLFRGSLNSGSESDSSKKCITHDLQCRIGENVTDKGSSIYYLDQWQQIHSQ